MQAPQEKSAEEPPEICFKDQPFDIHFHPSEPFIATGLINGQTFVYKYAEGGNMKLLTLKGHKGSVRSVRFSPDGRFLLTASKDKSIRVIDLQASGALAATLGHAHDEPINRLYFIDENTLASGDDDGTIKVWDVRQRTTAFQVHENEDFISDMIYQDRDQMLVATSGDGTLSVIDMRRRKLDARSDNQEDELLSVTLSRHGNKVVCGSQAGVIQIFSWNRFGDISDRMPGHPQSIDTIASLADNVICTGSSDGIIRVVSILPNKFLGVIGEHGEFPIERIALTADRKLLASCSHDNTVKFWNVEGILVPEEGDDDDLTQPAAAAASSSAASGAADAMEVDSDARPQPSPNPVIPAAAPSQSDSDSDDSESDTGKAGGSSRAEKRRQKRLRQKEKRRQRGGGGGGSGGAAGGAGGFFAGLAE